MSGPVPDCGALNDGYSALRHLTSALFSSTNQSRLVYMLTTYLDESGHSRDTDFVTMAGIVAREERWLALEPKWNKALSDFDLTEWHTTDYANSLNEYVTWKDDELKRQIAYGRFMEMVRELEGMPVGATVLRAAWDSMSKAARDGLLDPYYLCMQVCFDRSVGFRAGMSPDDKMLFVFDDNQEFKGRVPALYEHLRARAGYGELLLHNPSFARAKCTPQLQAADIVAYELRHFHDNYLNRPKLTPRWGYIELIRMVMHACGYAPFPWFGNYGHDELVLIDDVISTEVKLLPEKGQK